MRGDRLATGEGGPRRGRLRQRADCRRPPAVLRAVAARRLRPRRRARRRHGAAPLGRRLQRVPHRRVDRVGVPQARHRLGDGSASARKVPGSTSASRPTTRRRSTSRSASGRSPSSGRSSSARGSTTTRIAGPKGRVLRARMTAERLAGTSTAATRGKDGQGDCALARNAGDARSRDPAPPRHVPAVAGGVREHPRDQRLRRANAWHGFWGIVMCLALLVLLAWLIARVAGVEMALPVPEVVVAAGLSLIVLLFAVLKNLRDDYSTKWSYIGIVLAGPSRSARGSRCRPRAASTRSGPNVRTRFARRRVGVGGRRRSHAAADDRAPARAALERPDLDPRFGAAVLAAVPPRAPDYLRPVTELPLTGSCLCGAVRFEIVEPLVGAGYCHCTRCQRRTGTAASVNGSLRAAPSASLPARTCSGRTCRRTARPRCSARVRGPALEPCPGRPRAEERPARDDRRRPRRASRLPPVRRLRRGV